MTNSPDSQLLIVVSTRACPRTGFIHRSICVREVISTKQHWYAQHSWHEPNEGPVDRKGYSQNKENAFKGAFNRMVCTPANLNGKRELRQQQAETNL